MSGGRPPRGEEHPREDYRNRIKLMTAIGIPQTQMAGVLKMGLDTLHRHYKDELAYGKGEADTVVGGKIFEAAKRGESWACALWATRRMGWKETTATEVSGPGGGPVALAAVDMTKLTEEQLAVIATIPIPAISG